MPPAFNVNRSLIRSSAWMVALRWTLRAIGLVNTFILARLLSPEDFGLAAMAVLVIGLVEVFGQTGQILALIRHPDPKREHFDTVWTMSILIGAVITVTLWMLAPWAAGFFHEPRAVEIIEVLALRAFIGGFENIGVVAFRKDLQFSKEYGYQVAQRVITFVFTIAVALWLQSYWALVLGILAGRVVTVVISYLVHPYRPRPCLSKLAEIWSFSAWMLLVHVAQFVQEKVDEFVVGNTTDAATMGNYNVAADAATAPTVELILPASRALFPIFSRIAADRRALADAYLGVFATTAMVVCATSTGVMLVAGDFVAVLLGPRWSRAVPLVEWLAMSGAFYALMQSGITLLGASGHARTSAGLAVTRAGLTIPAIIAAAWLGSVETIAATRTLVTLAFVPGVYFALARIMPLRPVDVLTRLWRPVLSALVMAGTVTLLHPHLPALPPLRLVVEVGAGAVTYAASLLALWWLAGGPPGPERAVIGAILPKPAPPQPKPSGGRPRIFVISTFSSQSEDRPIERTPLAWLRNRGRRLLDLGQWRVQRRWGFHYSTYQDRMDSNRGDSAIRRATVQLLRTTFPQDVEITEFGWDQVDADFAVRANRDADLVVIAGGGYISCDADGNLPQRLSRHLDAYERLTCPLIGFGLGFNCLLSYQTGQPRLSEAGAALLRRLVRVMALVSVRDEVTRQALTFDGVVPVLVPDPALLLEPGRISQSRQKPDGMVWLGLNLAFHGPASTLLLERLFPLIVRVLQAFGRTHRCRILYFVHSDAERLIPRLLRSAGIAVTVVDAAPEDMLAWYGLLDIHLCEMLHSCILAADRGVPTLNLAYDSKNWAFYDLMGLTDILPAAGASEDEILAHLNGMLAGHDGLAQAILRRKEELRGEMDGFLARVARVVSGEDAV
jgi:lipopolysaccharide exporter